MTAFTCKSRPIAAIDLAAAAQHFADVREITRTPFNPPSPVVRASAIPSATYAKARSPVRFSNGSTAMDAAPRAKATDPPETGAINRYPRFERVSMNRGFGPLSPKTVRIWLTDLLMALSQSTKVRLGQRVSLNCSRVTTSPGELSSARRAQYACSLSLSFTPRFRNSPVRVSNSKTPNRSVAALSSPSPDISKEHSTYWHAVRRRFFENPIYTKYLARKLERTKR
jgi:hypothetical protein